MIHLNNATLNYNLSGFSKISCNFTVAYTYLSIALTHAISNSNYEKNLLIMHPFALFP